MEKSKLAGNERKTNLEMLRIVSMILIVMSHSDDWMGLAETYKATVCLNKFITDWLHIGGQIGVGCFLLISGYFMVDQEITTKKLLYLWGEVWFYTTGIWVIFLIINISNRNLQVLLEEGIYAFFPVISAHYWFVTAYIILMILSPFFNKFILIMNKRTYQYFLLAVIVFFVGIEGGIPNAFREMVGGGRIVPVFLMYFIAGYIRMHVDNSRNNANKHIVIAILAYILLYITVILFDLVGDRLSNEVILTYCYFWRSLNSPIVVIVVVELFLGFLRISQRTNKFINMIAKNTFGVYLLHTNRIISQYVLPMLFPIYKEKNQHAF